MTMSPTSSCLVRGFRYVPLNSPWDKIAKLPRAYLRFRIAALCRVYSRHYLLRYLPVNVSQKFPKIWKSPEYLATRRNTLRFRVNGSASSRDYFIASNRPTGRDLFALLAQGYSFWHRISIAHSCINQKKPTRPPLFQCLVPPDHGAVFIVNPDRNPLVRLLETAQSPSSFENFVPPLP